MSFVWFAILGGAAINLQLTGQANLADAVAQPEITLFTLLEQSPISTITSVLVIVLVAVFFVSGADAASIVMGMLTCRGILEPPRAIVAFWGTAMGASRSRCCSRAASRRCNRRRSSPGRLSRC